MSAKRTKEKQPGEEHEAHAARRHRDARELVETVVFVLVLVNLLRTFGAEAFVIPTGSMATTLYGAHKVATCPQCGHRSSVNASEEAEYPGSRPVDQGECQNCRYPLGDWSTYPLSYWRKWSGRGDRGAIWSGDRVLVGKFLYEFGDPQRWEVVVFKYPVDRGAFDKNHTSRTNFIKRLAGLPGESIRIRYGDIWVRGKEQGDFHIARKPPAIMRTVRRLVHDTDQPAQDLALIRSLSGKMLASAGVAETLDSLAELGYARQIAEIHNDESLARFVGIYGTAPRWQPEEEDWTASPDQRKFTASGTGAAWLGYRHITGGGNRHGTVEPSPITDFEAYNSGTGLSRSSYQINWVGDLMLECAVEVPALAGKAFLELGEGTRRYRCVLDLAGRRITLEQGSNVSSPGQEGTFEVLASADSPVDGPGEWSVCLANFDDRLTVWVDDELVAGFGEGVPVAPLTDGEAGPTQPDLQPARIGLDRLHGSVSAIRLYRDLYYTGTAEQSDYPHAYFDPSSVRDSLHAWRESLKRREPYEVTMPQDAYLMLGDNSPCSSDSRAWRDKHGDPSPFVPRHLLLGRALVLYWPPWNWGFVR